MATPKRTSATSSTTRSKKTAAPKAQETTTTLPQSNQTSRVNVVNVEELIRFRAYQLYVQRGQAHGYDMEDWLRAESEVTSGTRAH